MTDKPLDCIGLDLGTKFGKHDFQSTATSSTQPAAMTADSLAGALVLLKEAEAQSKKRPASGKATQAFFDKLKASVAPSTQPGVHFLFGFPIYVADDLPPRVVAEFRNADGEVVGRMTE